MSPRSLIVSFLAAACALSGVHAGAPVDVSFPETPPASALKNVVEDHFIGISYELSSFDTLWGKTADKQPTAMQNYMHNLAARMTKPLRVRVGGNGMDGSTYVPDMTTKVLEMAEDDPYFNDIPVNFGPVLFDVLNGMADKAGEMQFFVGLSMRNPHNLTNIQSLGLDARKKLGSRLDALLLGNEPDLYAGHGERDEYNITTYIPEIGNAINALKEVGAIADGEKLVGGPTICCSWDLDDILEAGLEDYPYKYYTLQHYPKHTCSGENADNTNITYFTSHSNVENYLGWQKNGVIQAQNNNIPVVLSEYNSVACGGSNISGTFATSLWAVDVGLKAASMNFSAAYLHTREFGVQYNLFDPPTEDTSTEANWRTGSPYYSALLLAESTYEGGTIVVDLNLNKSVTSPAATVAAYGLYTANANANITRGSLALINYAAESQIYVLPAGVAEKVQIKVLTAPSIYEQTNITWAGQTIVKDGVLEGNLQVIEMACDRGCQITLPGPAAAIVVLGNRTVFAESSPIPKHISDAPTLTPTFNLWWLFSLLCVSFASLAF